MGKPTAARLFGALTLSLTSLAVAYVYVYYVVPSGPDRIASFMALYAFATATGLVVGWVSLGSASFNKYFNTLMQALFCGAMVFALTLLMFAFAEMIEESMKLRYDNDLGRAAEGFGKILMDDFNSALAPIVGGTAAIGLFISGTLTHFVGRRWS